MDDPEPRDGPGVAPRRPLPPAKPVERKLYPNSWILVPALLLGLALVGVALFGLLMTVVGVSETNGAPNPFISDDFFCCGHPDTWGEVALGTVLTAAVAAASTVAILLAFMLVFNFRAKWKTFGIWPALMAAFAVLTIAGGIYGDRRSLRTAPSCDGFTVDNTLAKHGWGSRAYEEMLLGLIKCDTLRGRTPGQVQELLGTKDPTSRARTRYDPVGREMTYGSLRIRFKDRRAASAEIVTAGSGFD